MKKLSIIILFIIAISGWSLVALNTTLADSQTPYDHSNCQYPNRLSNPPDGCDNSDPARPECMKFGVEDCDLPQPDNTRWYPEEPEEPGEPITVTPIVKTCK